MLTDFNPNYRAPHTAPVCGQDGIGDPAWEEIYNHLDGPANMLEGMPDELRLETSKAFLELSRILIKDAVKKQKPVVFIGRAYILLVWLMSPNVFMGDDGKPLSLTKLAALLGTKANVLSPLSAALSRRFGIRNRFQAHNWRGRINHEMAKGKIDGEGGEHEAT